MSLPGRIAHVLRRHRARAREARIDVDHLRAALARLHHPLEPDRMVLRHVRAHDHDAVGVLQVLLERRRAAASERGAQTGHRGAMSNAGLVLDLHDAERGVELLHQVVLFVVERRAAEARDPHRAVQRLPFVVGGFPRRARASRSRGRRSCRPRCRGRALPTPCRADAGTSPCTRAAGSGSACASRNPSDTTARARWASRDRPRHGRPYRP